MLSNLKKALSVLLATTLLIAMFSVGASAMSAVTYDVGDKSYQENEPNNDHPNAGVIYNDYTVSGYVSGYDIDCFGFITETSAKISFLIVGSNSHLYIGLQAYGDDEYLKVVKTAYTNGSYAALIEGTVTAGAYVFTLLNDSTSYSNAYTFYFTISSTGSSHTHKYTSKVTAATCTSGGYTTYTCSCGYSYTANSTSALGHNYKSSTVAATCTSQGYTKNTCSRCKDSYNSNYTSALGHNYIISQADPTCTEDGGTKHTCSRCSDSYLTDVVPAFGHTYTEEGGVFCATCGEVDSGVTYPDVKRGQWYYTAVHYVTLCGFMSGYQNGKFGPADNLQRQDFVVAIARIAGADLTPYMNSTGGLKDVVRGSYYAPAVAWAVDQGIITGYDNGKFGVGDTVTREQVATIFYRYVGSPKVENAVATLRTYPDYRRVSVFAETAMAWAVENGVITGTNGALSPTTGASRAMIATIMMRMNEAGMFDPPVEEEPVDPEEPVEPAA